jgi:hypothetical protein
VATAGDPQYRVHLELDNALVSWPWHPSIQRASAAWINEQEPPAGNPGTEIVALPPRDLERLTIVATGDSPSAAEAGAEAAAASFLDHVVALQRDRYVTSIAAIETTLTTLRARYDERERSVESESNEIELIARVEAFESAAGHLSEFELRLSEQQALLDGLAPRYSRVDAEAVSPLRDRLGESVKLFFGLLLLGWIVLMVRTTPIPD